MDSDDIIVEDIENFTGSSKNQIFSHQGLVMQAWTRINEAGAHEMREGWYNEKVDNNGNITRTYIEDTRLKFIESVEIGIINLSCDFDKEAEDKIKKLKEKLDEFKDDLLKKQWNYYQLLPPRWKMEYLGKIEEDFFFTDWIFYRRYIEKKVEIYRKIAEELRKLIKRLLFYEDVGLIA